MVFYLSYRFMVNRQILLPERAHDNNVEDHLARVEQVTYSDLRPHLGGHIDWLSGYCVTD